jgi:hypothetical protein
MCTRCNNKTIIQLQLREIVKKLASLLKLLLVAFDDNFCFVKRQFFRRKFAKKRRQIVSITSTLGILLIFNLFSLTFPLSKTTLLLWRIGHLRKEVDSSPLVAYIVALVCSVFL